MPTAVAPAMQLFALVEFRCDVPRHVIDGGGSRHAVAISAARRARYLF